MAVPEDDVFKFKLNQEVQYKNIQGKWTYGTVTKITEDRVRITRSERLVTQTDFVKKTSLLEIRPAFEFELNQEVEYKDSDGRWTHGTVIKITEDKVRIVSYDTDDHGEVVDRLGNFEQKEFRLCASLRGSLKKQ